MKTTTMTAAAHAAPTAPTAAAPWEAVDLRPTVVFGGRDAGGALIIDGSAGEGGGQILRTSLALSMITGTPFVIEGVRAGRRRPGLMRQHLTCVRAAAAVCGARVQGDELGSGRLVFTPDAVNAGEYRFDVGSAGSAGLALQTVLLPLMMAPGPSRLTITGGTHNPMAPPHPFLANAWLPLLARLGGEVALTLNGAGFYPAGGGQYVVEIPGRTVWAPMAPLLEREAVEITLDAVVSEISVKIAERELVAATEALGDAPIAARRRATLRSHGPGNAFWLSATSAAVTNVFAGFGERRLRAEQVARDVVARYQRWRASGAAVEGHLADQLMLPLALAGGGAFTTEEVTLHSWTNAAVIEAFTPTRVAVHRRGERYRVAVDV